MVVLHLHFCLMILNLKSVKLTKKFISHLLMHKLQLQMKFMNIYIIQSLFFAQQVLLLSYLYEYNYFILVLIISYLMTFLTETLKCRGEGGNMKLLNILAGSNFEKTVSISNYHQLVLLYKLVQISNKA